MASLKKKAKKGDPISDRALALSEQIASLEFEIKKLDEQLLHTTTPKLRSTAIPHGTTVMRKSESPPTPKPVSHEPVFEEIKPLLSRAEAESPEHFNEFGVRKYDLPGLWNRLRDAFRRPTTSNPRLVNYLAAGGVHGLRPMRYEKRVARNRFVVFVVVLFLILLGVVYVFVRNH